MNKEKLNKYKIKYSKIAEMKRARIADKEIGKKFGCTHQNINLILNKYFFDEVFPETRGRKQGFFLKPISIRCLFCKKNNLISGAKINLSRKYCNQICYLKSQGKNINVNVSKMTKEEYRVYHNKRVKKYYHQHKTDPHFKNLISKYNKNAALKRKLENTN